MEQARGAYREAPRRALDAARPLLRIGPGPVAIIRDLESRPNCPRSRPRAAATASRPELLSDYQQLIQDLKQKLGLLQARRPPRRRPGTRAAKPDARHGLAGREYGI